MTSTAAPPQGSQAQGTQPRASQSQGAQSQGGGQTRHAAPDQERQRLEIALLKARIQHLELVVETAHCLMGSNHERLLRRLIEVPREMIELSTQLRRIDPNAA